jgi:sialate O-acetylesterase
MALSLDVSDVNNIHPKNNWDISRRLAWQALAKTYGHKEIAADGPTPESFSVKDRRLQVVFRDAGGGLISRDGKSLSCFGIAGENGNFVAAEALIEGNSVVVSSASRSRNPKRCVLPGARPTCRI